MKISERKKKVLDFLEKEISEKHEQRAENLLFLMEGIKAGMDLEKEDQRAAG
ncbi:MAG: hypothetical protein NC300_11290 [Bacteroidales bacterium]|nr:hypothetical protein [Clostridium sp.]MCM1204715.1 hypothetical protein [Bacteroidales bacterium]